MASESRWRRIAVESSFLVMSLSFEQATNMAKVHMLASSVLKTGSRIPELQLQLEQPN